MLGIVRNPSAMITSNVRRCTAVREMNRFLDARAVVPAVVLEARCRCLSAASPGSELSKAVFVGASHVEELERGP